tara:strand:- start:2954 stop:3274 length:321 start_codon:yes stop_codon:yes gene_type:complete
VDLTHRVAIPFDYVQMTALIKLDFVGHVQGGVGGGSTIPRITSDTIAGNGGGSTCSQVKSTDALIVKIAEIQGPIWANDHSIGVGDLCVCKSSFAGAYDGGNRGSV